VVQLSSAIYEEKKGTLGLKHIREGEIFCKDVYTLVTLMRPTVKRKAVVAGGFLYGSRQRGEEQRHSMER